MHTFCDTKQRTWPVEITVGTLKRVQVLCGVDLLKILDKKARLFSRLHDDPVLLVDVLFAVVQPKARELAVSDEEFAAGLGGQVLDDACAAFLGALADFFPRAGQRDAMRELIKKSGRLQERIIAHGVAELAAFDPETPPIDELLKLIEDAAAEDDDREAAAPARSSSGSSPACSASTPTPFLSASSSGCGGDGSGPSGTAPPT